MGKVRAPWALLVAGCLALCIGGCGSDKAVGAGASGVSAPSANAPLTLANVAELPQSNPASTVLRLWFWGQWGSLPSVAALYDPGTLRIAGEQSIFHVFTIQRSTLLAYRPQVVDDAVRGTTAFVAVQGHLSSQTPFSASFDLRRVGPTWLITHDSMLEGVLPTAVAGLVDPDPLRSVHPQQYVSEGDLVLRRVRAYASTFTAQQAGAPLLRVRPTVPLCFPRPRPSLDTVECSLQR